MNKLLNILLFSIVFWNVENYFDWRDGGFSSSDSEFSSKGAKHWTRKRFDAKTALIGKTFLWAGLPDVIGLAEVENETVLKALIYSEVLQKAGYRYIHYESGDSRGIDVALLYRASRVNVLESRAIKIDGIQSRDILYVCAEDRADHSIWHLLVNHHPSKYGGSGTSRRRLLAMECLKETVDSLLQAGQGNIVAMGDFNDTPDSPGFKITEPYLINKGAGLGAQGSIRFHGNWQLIDNFLCSPDLKDKKMEVLRPPFILERDRQYPGDKPKRTYIGPRYNGGVSDHLPVKLY